MFNEISVSLTSQYEPVSVEGEVSQTHHQEGGEEENSREDDGVPPPQTIQEYGGQSTAQYSRQWRERDCGIRIRIE